MRPARGGTIPRGLVAGPDPLGLRGGGHSNRAAESKHELGYPADAGDLGTIPECGSSSSAAPVPTLSLARPQGHAPWESDVVRNFAANARPSAVGRGGGSAAGSDVNAMVLEGPRGTVLQAVGSKEDHLVAGRAVAEIQKRSNASAAPRGLERRPPTPPRDRPGLGAGASALERSRQKAGEIKAREQMAFGAVYEHRDSSGKPRLIGSTSKMPERQYALDFRQNEEVQALCKAPGGARAELVWVGVGRGPVGEAEMAEVRRSVVDARSERLKIEKLSGIKPYSSHT